MKPYYQDADCTIFHGNCLEVAEHIAAASVHLVLSDLPYGSTAAGWDRRIPFPSLWEMYQRLLTADGSAVLTADQPFLSELVVSNLEWFHCEWIWRKNRASNFLSAKKRPMKNHETVLVFAPQTPRYFPLKTKDHEPVNFARRKENSSPLYRAHGESVNNAGDTTRWPKTVLDIKSVDNCDPERSHPTQKPVALFEYFIRTYSLPGETVLDNCAGSGTAAVAAKQCGRKSILIEGQEEFCEAAAKRMDQGVLELEKK